MSDDQEHLYKVGDRVIAVQNIYEEESEDNPRLLYAEAGDLLIVRKIDLLYPVNVSHESRLDNSFGVQLHEIRRE